MMVVDGDEDEVQFQHVGRDLNKGSKDHTHMWNGFVT